MSNPEDMVQAFRAGIAAANSLSGNDKIIPADNKGPRPALPYVSVRVTMPGAREGHDEDVRGLDISDDPQIYQKGQRRAVVELQAFGATAYDWLENFVLQLTAPSVLAVFGAVNFDVEPLGDPTNLSRLLETGIDARWSWDFEVNYSLTSATTPGAESQTELLSVIEDDRTVVSPPTNIAEEITHTL